MLKNSQHPIFAFISITLVLKKYSLLRANET